MDYFASENFETREPVVQEYCKRKRTEGASQKRVKMFSQK